MNALFVQLVRKLKREGFVVDQRVNAVRSDIGLLFAQKP